MAAPLSLTDQALERLRKLAEGNGLTPEAFELVEKAESVQTVTGTVRLTPQFDTQSRSFAGVVKGKNRRVAANFAALQEEIAHLKQKFTDSDPWLDTAMRDLQKAAGYGWGMQGARITLPEHSYVIAATESCPTCRGEKLLSCPQCAGNKNFLCKFCQGTRLEICPNCFGNGQNPANNQMACPICNGTRRISCRNCRGTGLLPCPTCQGKGGTVCGTCGGAGALTQEVAVQGSAEIDFKLGGGTHLPAGLLRALDRLGLENLTKGHGDVTIAEPPNADDAPIDKKTLHLSAAIPYADIKLRLNGKGFLISAFGKRGVLLGVPPFLDESLKPWREALNRAVRDTALLNKALEARVLQDALKLELAGESSPAGLRRLYGVGLSPAAAFDIMRDMRLALRRYTRQSRIAAGVIGFAASTGLFAGLLLTRMHDTATRALPPLAVPAVDLALPALAMILSWIAVQRSGQWALRRRFPQATIKATRKAGNIGHATLAAIFAAYGFILALTPYKPVWLMQLLR